MIEYSASDIEKDLMLLEQGQRGDVYYPLLSLLLNNDIEISDDYLLKIIKILRGKSNTMQAVSVKSMLPIGVDKN